MVSIADRIRKLIAHERSAREIGNLAEAEAFATKIQQLLFEYKLSMSDIDKKDDPFGHERTRPTGRGTRIIPWSTQLAIAVCSASFCSVVEVQASSQLIFVGRETDRAIAIAMWQFLYDLAIAFAKNDVPMLAVLRPKMHKQKIRNRYLMGFALAIFVRLHSEAKRSEDKAGVAGLVLVSGERKELEAYKSSALPALTQTKLAIPRRSLAFRAGFARGLAAPLKKHALLQSGAEGGL